MTRRMLSAFRENGFENPIQAANQFTNVIFAVKVCPPLQAELCLLQPRMISKRRRSTSFSFGAKKMKFRRMSCAVTATGNLNNFIFK